MEFKNITVIDKTVKSMTRKLDNRWTSRLMIKIVLVSVLNFLTMDYALAVDNAIDRSWYVPEAATSGNVTESECETQADQFARIKVLDEKCFPLAFNKASVQQKALSLDGLIFVTVYKNIIFILEKKINEEVDVKKADKKSKADKTSSKAANFTKELRILAGDSTQLNDIKSVSLDANGKEVAVVDSIVDKISGRTISEIKIFATRRNGSVAPARIIRADFLDTASDIQFHPTKQEIFVLTKNPGAIYSVSTSADSRSADPQKQVVALREIKGTNTQLSNPTDFLVSAKELIVLDLGSNKILRYLLEGKGALKPKIVDVPENAQALKWSVGKKEILLVNSENQVVKTWPALGKKNKK